MKLVVKMPDDRFEQLEAAASRQKKEPSQFVLDNLDALLKYNPIDNQILLDGKAISAIEAAVGGGRAVRTPEAVVKLFQDNFKIGLGGMDLALSKEDAHALKAQYEGMGFTSTMPYEEYVKWVLKDALSMFLWGSTTGTMSLR